jgi:hypothetical protein
MPGREFLNKVVKKDAGPADEAESTPEAEPKKKKRKVVVTGYRYNGAGWPGDIPARDLTPKEVERLGVSGKQLVELGCFDEVVEEEDEDEQGK